MQLHLIRHPRPAVAPGICYGQTDLGLAECPATVAERLRPLLPETFALHTSPLARARLLAEALGTPREDDRLKEIHFGDWEGRSFADIGSAIDDWAADPLGFRAPGGESPREMAARVLAWLEEATGNGGQTPISAEIGVCPPLPPLPEAVVVVAHGGPLRAIAGHLLGMPPERWIGLDFGCGQVTRIDVERWGVVLKWFNR
ncbi:alpha-ribazole phosphatase family protein [Thauera sp.]|uniref:alpha-ribazole phosphatase family protein n=1 Tax=Thauera sp. TaxID=1905334 RepID=UPI00258B032D|nr:alpha-ribazole phosphatase family protein [Thauera sp.]